jgi:hypothetical protein
MKDSPQSEVESQDEQISVAPVTSLLESLSVVEDLRQAGPHSATRA